MMGPVIDEQNWTWKACSHPITLQRTSALNWNVASLAKIDARTTGIIFVLQKGESRHAQKPLKT